MIVDSTKAIGFFMGLAEGGLEFGAELTLNYDSSYQNLPMIGQYVVIELERPEEAVLARICAISSHGRLASSAGEDLGSRSVDQHRPMPENIKKQFLRYRCSIRLLGLLRIEPSKVNRGLSKILFTPSHRRLPHLGAKVAFASGEVLQSVGGARRKGEAIGFLAFGEFVYAQGHNYAPKLGNHFITMAPVVEPKFDASALVARRSAVVARAGYGKSNLLKILFSRLYEQQPTLSRRGTVIPVGTLVLDPDGDYFWPGAGSTAPPGLCDVEGLRDAIVVATDRNHSEAWYQSFKVTSPRLDLRDLSPGLVFSCYLNADRAEQRGSQALYRLNRSRDAWSQLVDAAYVDVSGNQGALTAQMVQQICGLSGTSAEVVATGIRNTMLDVVSKLHNPQSTLVQVLTRALSTGKMVVVDLSLMRGQPATAISAILLRHLFEHNVVENTKADGTSIPIIALIEEAQKVLEGSSSSNAPFIEWVKEGRKYDLGAVLVTQQPGALDQEILSQCDNFFAFHLISEGDLRALKNANGHFSEDILASLLNEPLEGHGVFWSSAGENKTPYPIPFRAFNFGDLHQRLDAAKTRINPDNYAARLKAEIKRDIGEKEVPTPASLPSPDPTFGRKFHSIDELTKIHHDLAREFRSYPDVASNFERQQIPWFVLMKFLKDKRKRNAGELASAMMTSLFGLYEVGWRIEMRTSNSSGRPYECVIILDPDEGKRRLATGELPTAQEDPDLIDVDASIPSDGDMFT